jgi:hypothetical protein
MKYFAPMSVLVVLVGLFGACAPAQVFDEAGNPQASMPGPEVAGAPLSSIVHPIAGGKHSDLDAVGGMLLAISAYDGAPVIYQLDWYSGALIGTIPLGDDLDFGVGFDTLRGKYLTTQSSGSLLQNVIKVYDGVNPVPTLVLQAPFVGATGIAYDSNRDVYWVTFWSPNILASVNPTTGQLVTSISTSAFGCTRPAGTAYDPATDEITIGGRDQNTVFVVNAATGALVTSFLAPDGGNNPQGCGSFSTGASLWLSSWNSPSLYQVDNGHSLNVALDLTLPGNASVVISNIPPGADCRLFFDLLSAPYTASGPFAGASISPGQIQLTLGWPAGVPPLSNFGFGGSVAFGPFLLPSGLNLNVCVVDLVGGAVQPPIRADGGTVQ